MCEHCRAVHLRGMREACTSEALISIAERTIASGGSGMLISGGCDRTGRVPLLHLRDAISQISSMGLEINIHAGFIGPSEARELVSAGVRRFSVDIHQDPAVIKGVLHLDRPPSDYGDLLDAVITAGGVPVPHLTAGLGGKDIAASADLLLSRGLRRAVLLGLVPSHAGSPMPGASTETVVSAVDILSGRGLEVTLGCMRDRSCRDMEAECIRHGVMRIANPSRETQEWVKANGYSVKEDRRCCCMSSE